MTSLLASLSWPVLDRVHFGSKFAISPHGVGIAFGYLLGSWWVLREGPKRGLKEEHASSLLFWALIGTIFGARFFYVIAHLSEFNSFTDMLKIYNGGISLIGGIVGAIAFAYPVMRRHHYRFLQVMDSAAIGLPFGIFVGRIGDLIIGDHLGKPTSVPWAFAYDGGHLSGFSCVGNTCTETLLQGLHRHTLEITPHVARLIYPTGVVQTGNGVHQTALYDFLISGSLFLFMYLVMASKPRREGVLIMTFAIWYGVGRVITDSLRVDKRFFGLTGSQWSTAAIAAISTFVLVRWAIQSRRRPPPPPAPPEASAGEPAPAAGEPAPATTSFRPPPEPGTRGGGAT